MRKHWIVKCKNFDFDEHFLKFPGKQLSTVSRMEFLLVRALWARDPQKQAILVGAIE